jgi:hypothetical protein
MVISLAGRDIPSVVVHSLPMREDDTEVEQLYELDSNLTSLERTPLYEPLTGAGHPHRTMLLRRLDRVGMEPYQT